MDNSCRPSELLEENEVVKGVSRRVIVVKNPDRNIFEQAIFIVREDYLHSGGVSAEQLMKQARRAADSYMRDVSSGQKKHMSKLPAPAFAAAGAAATGIAWLALRIIGVG